MGLGLNLGAIVGTGVLFYIILAVYKKAKDKPDSPINKIISKYGRKNKEISSEDMFYYKRLPEGRGVKW